MIKYIINRLLLMILVLLGVLAFLFALSKAPGSADPVASILGENYTQEAYQATYIKLGLDRPIIVQYFSYVWGIVTRLDLGTSYMTGQPVLPEVLLRFPISLRLSLIAVAISVPIGIVFGVVAAYYQNSVCDYVITVISMIGQAMPNFWIGLMLILIFSLNFKWFPASGLTSWKGYVLPALTMASTPISVITRLTRSTMLEVIRQDYIRTARSKGLTEKSVLFGHALQNAAIPIVTQITTQISVTVGGATVVENIFLIAGLGSYLSYSITANDQPAVQGSIVFFAVFVTVMNILLEILYGYIDPRIKGRYASTSRQAKKIQKEAEKTAKEAV